MLASAYGHLGSIAASRAALDQLLHRMPGLTASDERLVRPFARAADREQFLEGLRKAGLTSDSEKVVVRPSACGEDSQIDGASGHRRRASRPNYNLAINLESGRAFGLAVPPTLVPRAGDTIH